MFTRDIEIFIKSYVEDITAGSAAVFAGAGLSIPAGFVSWKELIKDIAYELGLDVEKETDLVSIAQFHVNEKKQEIQLTRKLSMSFHLRHKRPKTTVLLQGCR